MINYYQKKIIYLSIPAVITRITMLHFVVTKINFKIFIIRFYSEIFIRKANLLKN